ncbi:hypothetical protein SHIRM173S_02548 [Streptomyces hirsutus]
MFAGPFMNLILAVALFLTVLMGFGVQQQTTTVSSVSPCVISQSENRDTCEKSDPRSPAEAAGMKAGDRIVAFDGVGPTTGAALSDLIRDSAGKAVPIVVDRDGQEVTLQADIATNLVAKKDSDGLYVEGEYVKAGFLGFSAATGVVKQDFGDSVVWMTDRVGDAVDSLAALPSKVPALWDAAFGDGPREQDSPMGVVGAARVGGEIATLDIPASQQMAMFVMLLAGFNLSLFLFNMLPLDAGLRGDVHRGGRDLPAGRRRRPALPGPGRRTHRRRTSLRPLRRRGQGRLQGRDRRRHRPHLPDPGRMGGTRTPGAGVSPPPALAGVLRYALADVAPVKISLYVNDFNTPARRTYRRVGFEEVGEFYEHPVLTPLDPARPRPARCRREASAEAVPTRADAL